MLFALPVFAGIPTTENAPANSEEDAWFWLSSLSEEELMEIFGEAQPIPMTMDGTYYTSTGYLYEFANDAIIFLEGYSSTKITIKEILRLYRLFQKIYNILDDIKNLPKELLDEFFDWVEENYGDVIIM